MQKELEVVLATVPYAPCYLEQFTGVSFLMCDIYINCAFEALQKEVKFRLHK